MFIPFLLFYAPPRVESEVQHTLPTWTITEYADLLMRVVCIVAIIVMLVPIQVLHLYLAELSITHTLNEQCTRPV